MDKVKIIRNIILCGIGIAALGGYGLFLLKSSNESATMKEQKRRSNGQRAQMALNEPPKVREWVLQGGTMREIIIPVAGVGTLIGRKTCYVWTDVNKSTTMSCDQDSSLEMPGIERPEINAER